MKGSLQGRQITGGLHIERRRGVAHHAILALPGMEKRSWLTGGGYRFNPNKAMGQVVATGAVIAFKWAVAGVVNFLNDRSSVRLPRNQPWRIFSWRRYAEDERRAARGDRSTQETRTHEERGGPGGEKMVRDVHEVRRREGQGGAGGGGGGTGGPAGVT